MSKSREYASHYPDWYWTTGLHDAGIVGVESFEFPFDYNKFIGEKSKYNRNLLVLKINAKGALYDTSVEEIRLYNYKILIHTPKISPLRSNLIEQKSKENDIENGRHLWFVFTPV